MHKKSNMIKIANNTNTLYVWIAILCVVECLIVILASNNTLLDGISCQWRGFSITASIVSFIACFVCLKDKCLIFNQHFSITLILLMCFALTRMCGTVMDYCNVILCCVLCANLPVLFRKHHLEVIYSFVILIYCVIFISYYINVLLFSNGLNVNENTVGYSLLLSLACVVLLNNISGINNHKIKWLGYAVILLLLLMLVCLRSRTGLIAVLVSLVPMLKVKKYVLFFILIFCCFFFINKYKTNSTLGRKFIYYTAVTMITERPSMLLQGGGKGYFERNYMLHQASRLESSDEETCLRADNIHHPLNEFLLVLIDYGIVVLVFLLAIIVFVFTKTKSRTLRSAMLTIGVFSLFSYPLQYPITWITFIIVGANYISNKRSVETLRISTIMINFMISTILLVLSIYSVYNDYIWKKAYDNADLGNHMEAAYLYHKILVWQKHNDSYIYSYVRFLAEMGDYQQAQKMMGYLNVVDYETEILRGDIYKIQNKYSYSIPHFLLAHKMCPNRFLPLSALYSMYRENHDYKMQRYIGKKILDKHIKVNSKEIESLKNIITKEINE